MEEGEETIDQAFNLNPVDSPATQEDMDTTLTPNETEHMVISEDSNSGSAGKPEDDNEDYLDEDSCTLEMKIRSYLKKRNEEDIASVWLQGSPEAVARQLIVQSWFRRIVPRIYSPTRNTNCLQLTFDDKLGTKLLIEPLEKFIFNNEDPEGYFKKMKESCCPPSVCGRVFKPGEPTYGCRDCGLDPTCVLCVECFKNSPHQKHRYKISTSTGGGYCDCGDNEAWRKDFYCTNHDPELVQGKGTSLQEIQQGLKERIDLVLSIVVKYCYERFLDDNIVQLSCPDLTLCEKDKEELGLKENGDVYCTAMINDEIHTFEVVIQTLQRAIDCSKREAKEFATMIDREGRSVVFISDFSQCAKVKQVSERQTSRTGQPPLRIEVLHSFVVSHQIFALKLMDWIKKIVSLAPEIREIFNDIMTRTQDITRPAETRKENVRVKNLSYLVGILQADTKLWKAQRNTWHNLIIAGLLRDYEMKKQFAIEFTKRYPELFKEFINDDHDHAISVTSLSVQIYTVPTIAHYLIEQHDVIFTIMRTFLSEFEQKYNDNRLQLQRSPNGPFKRAQYAILDLKYLLTNPPSPSTWNDTLRKAFIHGVSCVTKLLGSMQEMDPIVRQTGAHMEYEPEWETAFNFHIKLTPVTSLIQQWCSTDAQICIRTYRLALKEMQNVIKSKTHKTCCRELFNHSATCYDYDVMSQEVSVHLPLSRFIAGMHLYFDQFDLNFNSQQLNLEERPTPLMLIEPSLRMQVLIAQVHCGLWKRNGYALLNQIYFYHNVRCRSDMLDKDIIALQLGASLIESNEYLIHMLNRYDLMAWTEEDYDETHAIPSDDDTSRHVITISEQFLELLNTIVTARYVAGLAEVTHKDCVQNEIIQYLCKEPMTHSALNKVLVENVNCETGLEQYIQEVATFKKTAHAKAGYIYDLKPEYYERYDVYHYHFTHEERSTAEERQRARKKAAGEAEYFPPPKLPLFTSQFSLVPNLLMSDVMLNIVVLVLKRSLKKMTRSYSDTQLRLVLHLIGVGLNEELARKQAGSEEDFFQFTSAARKWHVFEALEGVLQERNLAQHHELIFWMFRKYHELKPLEDMGAIENLVQLSHAEDEKAKKKKLAAAIREKRLAEMKACQNSFRSVNADLFQEDEAAAELTASDEEMIPEIPVALGLNQTKRPPLIERFMCILCHKEQTLQEATSIFVECAYVQRSTVLSQSKDVLAGAECKHTRENHIIERNPLFLQPDLLCAPHVSCCGHAMHSVCWKKHYEGIVLKERRRPYRHPSSFNIDLDEYLCPMCGCLCNATLIVAEPCLLTKQSDTVNYDYLNQLNSFDEWIHLWADLVTSKVPHGGKHVTHPQNEEIIMLNKNRSDELVIYVVDPAKMDTKHKLVEYYYNVAFYHNMVQLPPRIYPPLVNDEIPRSFLNVVYTASLGFDLNPNIIDYRLPIMAWQAVAYTITAFESCHRELNMPFFGPSVPSRQAATMQHLARSGSVLTSFSEQLLNERNDTIESLALNLMEVLLNLSGPGVSYKQHCILDIDAFFLLVSLTYASENVFDKLATSVVGMGGSDVVCMKDLFLLKLVTIAHFAQIFIAIDLHDRKYLCNDMDQQLVSGNMPYIGTLKDLELGCFGKSCKVVWKSLGIEVPPNINWINLFSSILEKAKPFLMCAAKFYEGMTGIPPRESMYGLDPDVNELLAYLGLSPKQEEFFEDFGSFSFAKLFANSRLIDITNANKYHTKIDGSVGRPEVLLVQYPRKILDWPELPMDYIELINVVSTFTCRSHEDNESRNPTKCVICGAILCSQSYCCQYSIGNVSAGACTYHSFYCGGSTGIFLRIRECKMFFLCGKTKGAFVFPPYVDAYGETDQGLRRGNPMALCVEKIQQYRKSWILHTIPEEIARITENSTTITIAEWQYL